MKVRPALKLTQIDGLVIVLLFIWALSIPVAQAIAGVRLFGKMGAYDGPFAVSALMQFKTELMKGVLLPRWAFAGNFGLGSPIFFFYPPGAYYLASGVSALSPGAPEDVVLGAASVVLTLLSVLTCAGWLRRPMGWRYALLGGVFYAVMPYVVFINPQQRLAFAEMTAAPLWPLAFWAVDAGRGRWMQTTTAVALVVCTLSLVHVPSLILCFGLLLPYAALGGGDFAQSGTRTAAAAAGTALGMAMAAFYLAPAAALQGAIPIHYMNFGLDSSLLSPKSLSSLSGKAQNFALIVPVTGAGAMWALGRTRASLRDQADYRAIVGVLILAFILVTPLAGPIWRLLPPLQKVQFPWRLLQPISLLGAAAIIYGFPRQSSAIRWSVIAAMALMSLGLLALSVAAADRSQTATQRNNKALALSGSQALEYTPLPAGDLGWEENRDKGPNYAGVAATLKSTCLSDTVSRQRESLSFTTSHCGSLVRLPIFYFPTWRATVDGRSGPILADPKTGLVDVPVNPSSRTLTLTQTALPIERVGGVISVVAGVFWLVLLGFTLLSRHFIPTNIGLIRARPRLNAAGDS